MSPTEANEENLTKDPSGGEIEIENFPIHEVEIKGKDRLPVFNHFRGLQSNWGDR